MSNLWGLTYALAQSPSFLAPSATSSIPEFLKGFFDFALVIAGVLAVGMIVVGGIFYSISGAVDKKSLGKEMIMGALWGLLLLLASYVILRTVNPELVNLNLPPLEQVEFSQCTEKIVKIGEGVEIELPKCDLGEWPFDFDTGKCKCYVDEEWKSFYAKVLSGHTDIQDDVDITGKIAITGCENPYQNICNKYGGSYKESVALECKALGTQQPTGLVRSEYGGLVNSSVYENYKKALDCVVQQHPELKKSDFSFNSGFRNPVSQYLTRKSAGTNAAKPCCSNHGAGCALDLRHKGASIKSWDFSDGKLKDCFNRFGLKAELRNNPNEPWHYSPSGR